MSLNAKKSGYYVLLVSVCLSLAMPDVHATYSIVACEPSTGRCGVAIATHNLAVGHGVPFAVAELGAGVSQFETNPCHPPAAISSLKQGVDAKRALDTTLNAGGECVDGQGIEYRQIGIVSMHNSAAAFTGQQANDYAGHRAEGLVSVQGNGLVSKAVLDAMWDRFHSGSGSLAERLLSALEAGEATGGQKIGVMSAALLVATPDGWPVDTDLRVDFSPATAIQDLRTAFNANVARQLLFRSERAARNGDEGSAQSMVKQALDRAPGWDRIWLRAARMAKKNHNEKEQQQRICHFKKLNPVWAAMLKDEFDLTNCHP